MDETREVQRVRLTWKQLGLIKEAIEKLKEVRQVGVPRGQMAVGGEIELCWNGPRVDLVRTFKFKKESADARDEGR